MTTRNLLRTVAFCMPALLAARHVRPVEPVLSTDPLGAEQTAIYRSFLTTYLNDPANSADPTLNVVLTTEAFNPTPEIHPDQACLWADDIDDLSTPQLHHLPALALPSDRVKLVDTTPPSMAQKSRSVPFVKHKQPRPTVSSVAPAPRPATLLSLSEVVFNRKHTLASFHYSYVCGEECGHGETLVYELQHGVWKLAKSGCSKWVI